MFVIRIKELGTQEVIKEMKSETEYRANQIADGININLNHSKHYTDVEKFEITIK
jgi:hypothetical protein